MNLYLNGEPMPGTLMTLSEEAILNKITQRETFSATIEGGGFTLKIDKYEPALSAAIHNGGNHS